MDVIPHNTVEELLRRSRSKKCSFFSDRIKAVAYALCGETAEAVAEKLDHHISWVFHWVSRYNKFGFDGLKDIQRSGQPKKLTSAQEQVFKKRVLDGPTSNDDGISRFTGTQLILILKNEFSADYSLAGVYKLLHRLRLSHITPRPKHPKNDPQKMEDWKKELPLLFKKQKINMKINPLKSGSKTKRGSGNKAGSQKSGQKRTRAQSKSIKMNNNIYNILL